MALHTGTVGPVIRADNMEPEVLRQLISCLSGARDGILHGTDLAVTQNGGGAMSVIVSSGFALISGTDSAPAQGQYHVYNDANVTVTVPTADPSHPRIDLICATIEDAYYAGGSNTAILQDVTGTPAVSPTVPATPADSLVLAHIYVGTGAASILTANINGTTGTNNPDAYPFTPMRSEGLLASAVSTGGTNTGTAAPGTVVPGLTCVVNTQANRKIRVRGFFNFTPSAAVTCVTAVYRDGSTQLGFKYMTTVVSSTYEQCTIEFLDTPTAGVHQYTLNAWSSAANTLSSYNNTSIYSWLTVEDIGPA
jgi:hypothetical protein